MMILTQQVTAQAVVNAKTTISIILKIIVLCVIKPDLTREETIVVGVYVKQIIFKTIKILNENIWRLNF